MEPKNPLYRYRPLRPLKFYEDFLNIDTKQFAGKSGVLGVGLANEELMHKVVVQHIKETLPEWESYSEGMLRVLELNFKTALRIEWWGETKHTVVLTFINGMIGSYNNQAVLTNPNIFDLELIKEMVILQQEAWPKLAS